VAKKATDIPSVNAENARVLADLVIEPTTPEALRIKILNKLLEASEGSSFFRTMFEEKLSLASCPDCDHENHWLIPEDELNKMGWVTHEKDPRVPIFTSEETCKSWEEACAKKKVTV